MSTPKYLKTVVDALCASALSGQHLILISAMPGWGKTEAAVFAAENIAGGREYFPFVRIDPSTPVSKLQGMYDPAEMLKGHLVRLTEGTPYDPHARIVVLDELPRGTDVTFDTALDITNRMDTDTPPTVWATANFMVTGERSAAMRDRFALWVWMKPTLDNPQPYLDTIRVTKRLELDGTLPTWEEVLEVREMEPGDNAHKAISSFINLLSVEAAENGFPLNPRRLRQWYEVLFRYGAWLTGSDDFTEVPAKAKALMAYAWPTPTWDDYVNWSNIAEALADVIRTAVYAALNDARAEFEQMVEDIENGRKQKTNEVVLFGQLNQTMTENLDTLAPGHPDVEAGKRVLNELFKAAINGASIQEALDNAWSTMEGGNE